MKSSRTDLRNTIVALCAVLLVTGFPVAEIQAASVKGKVVDSSGAPLAGAIVSLANDNGRTESVYSNAEGTFSLNTGMTGKLALRVRKRYHDDHIQTLKSIPKVGKPLTVRLTDITDPKRLSDDHPALSFFSRINFDKDESSPFSRRNFTRDCLSCHSVGGIFTRTPRSAEGWLPTVQRMHGYVGNSDPEMIKRRAELLSKAFDGSLVHSRPQITYDELVSASKLYEWKLSGSSVPHDAEVSMRTGKVYITDLFAGGIFELNMTSDKLAFFKEPADGTQPGGGFAKAGLTPPFGLTAPHGPHSLAEANDGNFYMTDAIGSTLIKFDTVAKTFKHFDIGHGALYPHTIRVAKDGVIWFTIFASNQIGRFDPATGKTTVIYLPGKLANAGLFVAPMPYGIDVNPKDGSIWYAHFGNDTVGRVDPTTYEVREMDSPVHAPRRLRFDASGTLWVAGFSDGAIARIDVDTWQAKVYPLPTFAPNEIPAPYALAVNPETQEIWVNDTAMDLVWRFLPKEERFIAYPLPLKGSYTRDFSFTKEGWACSSNNPLPAASLEGFTAELVCIDPDGAKKPAVTAKAK